MAMNAPPNTTDPEFLEEPCKVPRTERDGTRHHDVEQILDSLAMSPDERLATLQEFVDTFWTPAHG